MLSLMNAQKTNRTPIDLPPYGLRRAQMPRPLVGADKAAAGRIYRQRAGQAVAVAATLEPPPPPLSPWLQSLYAVAVGLILSLPYLTMLPR